jgi:hypothetical protein
MDGVRPVAASNAHRLLDRVTARHDEIAASTAEGGAQIGEAVEQEGEPVGRRVGATEDLIVEHEQRDDELCRPNGIVQRRMVLHTEVPVEQNDGALDRHALLHNMWR